MRFLLLKGGSRWEFYYCTVPEKLKWLQGYHWFGMPNLRTRFFQSPDDQPVRAKLFGIGSAGCNIIEGAAYPTVAFSTSSADLARSHAERKVLIGQDRLIGVSDSDPDIVRRLPSVVGHELLDVFNNTELAFLMCGLGGTAGSLGAKMLSSIAKAKACS